MKYFRLVWKNVFRKKTRMFLTTSSIILVLVLIVTLVSLLRAMEADPSGGKGANRLVVQHATGLANFLPLSMEQRIEQIPGVVAASPEIWFGGIYKDDRPENFFGQLSAEPETFFDKIFDEQFYSFEIGFAKPEAGYFRTIMDRIDVSPDRVLFIDDHDGNVAGAREIGIHSELFPHDGGVAALTPILARYGVQL